MLLFTTTAFSQILPEPFQYLSRKPEGTEEAVEACCDQLCQMTPQSGAMTILTLSRGQKPSVDHLLRAEERFPYCVMGDRQT